MNKLIQFCMIGLLTLSCGVVNAQSQTQSYTGGNLPFGGNTPSDTCWGIIGFAITPGSSVDSIRIQYDVIATGAGYRSDAMTKAWCLEGTSEAAFTPGTLTGAGVESYNRLISSLYTGVTASGILNFNLAVYDSYNAAANCAGVNDLFVDTCWITVYYTEPPTPFVYVSSTTTQSNTSDIPHCTSDQEIIGLEVVTSGNTGVFNLTELQINMNGTILLADATNIGIYYTGTSSTFATTSPFGSIIPAGGTLIINGSQTLSTGTNYFWIAYDMTGPVYTGGNIMDAECTQITVDGSDYVPTITNSGAGRTTEGCQVYPGNVSSGIGLWFKANEIPFADGALTTAWGDESGNSNNAGQIDVNMQPVFRDNPTYNLNFNATVDFVMDSGTSTNSDRLEFPTPAKKDQNIFLVFETSQISTNSFWHYHVPVIYGGDINPGIVANQSDFCVGLGDWFGTGDKISFGGGGDTDFSYHSGTSVISTGLPVVLVIDRTDVSTNELDLSWRVNGFQSGTHNEPLDFVADSMPPLSVMGNHLTNLDHAFDGGISEVVVFEGNMNYTNKNKIESYLALKYGVTLNQNTPQDYVLGDGTISWNSAVVPVLYNNDIAGVSRDDISAQYQKQSRSVNPGSLVTIGLGPIALTNSTNGGSFGADQHTLTWSNNRDANAWVLAEVPPLIDLKLEREWFTEENIGDVGTVTIEVADADLAPTGGSTVHLLIDADGDFSTGALIIPMILNAGIWTLDVNFTDEYYFSFGLNTIPLPIELLNFNATPVNNMVKLDWRTISEKDNDYFTIQKTRDGHTWVDVTEVKGKGTTQESKLYAGVDLNPYPNTSYYRLKQTDFNGEYSYSEVRSVQFLESSNILLYPNPAKEVVIIEGESINSDEIKIFNAQAQEISYHMSITELSEKRFRIDVSHLSSGVYWIQVNTDNIKFVIN